MVEVINSTFSNNLLNQYSWFNSQFLPALKHSSDDFFVYDFNFKLMSLSLNINAMFQDDSYFVTKINIDEKHEVFIRCSEKAISLILDRVLEPQETKFNLNNMSELEAKIITNFNDYFYNSVSHLIQRPPGSLKFKTFDILHLTYLMKPEDDEKDDNVAKIIVSMPYQFLHPEDFVIEDNVFSDYSFRDNLVEVDIKIGTTLFSVNDLKSLEEEDIVLFESSNLHTMKVICGEYKKKFNITPNPALIIAIDDTSGGDEMENPSTNLWDSIQIEMSAEFDKIKMPLGDLKKIDEGVVIDVSSIYSNKVSLKVEEKLIAEGELVIINDRYGVKINKVLAKNEEPPKPQEAVVDEAQDYEQEQYQEQVDYQQEQIIPKESSEIDEEFDYSDFELDDEDI